MAGKLCEIEQDCVFFNALSEKNKEINRTVRLVTEKGGELPGSLNPLYESCMQGKTINEALSQRLIDLVHP